MASKCKVCDTNVGILNLTNGVCKSCIDKGETNKEQNYSSVSDYGASRCISKIISFIGWLAVWIGVIIVITGLVQSSEYGGFALMAVLPGLGMSISGLFLVVTGQITRATVDNASHTKAILEIMKEKT